MIKLNLVILCLFLIVSCKSQPEYLSPDERVEALRTEINSEFSCSYDYFKKYKQMDEVKKKYNASLGFDEYIRAISVGYIPILDRKVLLWEPNQVQDTPFFDSFVDFNQRLTDECSKEILEVCFEQNLEEPYTTPEKPIYKKVKAKIKNREVDIDPATGLGIFGLVKTHEQINEYKEKLNQGPLSKFGIRFRSFINSTSSSGPVPAETSSSYQIFLSVDFLGKDGIGKKELNEALNCLKKYR